MHAAFPACVLQRDCHGALQGFAAAFAGETFWCHVTGHALNRDRPHESGIWTFEDLGSRRQAKAALTPREREVAAQVMQGLTSKEIGRVLGISHRTVETHRESLMRKLGIRTVAGLTRYVLDAGGAVRRDG